MNTEEQLLYDKVKKKFKFEEDPMRNINRLNIPFGESPFTFFYNPRPTVDDEDRIKHKFSEIFSMTPFQFLGYNCLEVDENKYYLFLLNRSKIRKKFGEDVGMEDDNMNQEDELGSLIGNSNNILSQ